MAVRNSSQCIRPSALIELRINYTTSPLPAYVLHYVVAVLPYFPVSVRSPSLYSKFFLSGRFAGPELDGLTATKGTMRAVNKGFLNTQEQLCKTVTCKVTGRGGL
jgi:hypothetical protein